MISLHTINFQNTNQLSSSKTPYESKQPDTAFWDFGRSSLAGTETAQASLTHSPLLFKTNMERCWIRSQLTKIISTCRFSKFGKDRNLFFQKLFFQEKSSWANFFMFCSNVLKFMCQFFLLNDFCSAMANWKLYCLICKLKLGFIYLYPFLNIDFIILFYFN